MLVGQSARACYNDRRSVSYVGIFAETRAASSQGERKVGYRVLILEVASETGNWW